MKYQALVFLLAGATFALRVLAQIPAVCVPDNQDRLPSDCCPMSKGARCGGPTRGICEQVSEICNVGYSAAGINTNYSDQRFNWPSGFFQRVCKCNGNYDGFDCGECKFGYQGEDCQTKKPTSNRGTVESIGWEKYNRQLQTIKTTTSRYKVFIGGDATQTNRYKNVNLYNLIVWMHHFAARTETGKNSPTESGSRRLMYIFFTVCMRALIVLTEIVCAVYAYSYMLCCVLYDSLIII